MKLFGVIELILIVAALIPCRISFRSFIFRKGFSSLSLSRCFFSTPLNSKSASKSDSDSDSDSKYNDDISAARTSNEPRIIQNDLRLQFGKIFQTATKLFLTTAVTSSLNTAQAVDDVQLDSSKYKKALVNIQSDDFWYPPYMIGTWNTTMTFAGANFTDKVPIEILAQNDNLPGFSKYSVIFTPDMGKNINDLVMRYVQLDSHPREDHPFNLRKLVSAFLPNNETVIDSAPYSFQKAPDWFHSPSNKWQIKYHDASGKGVIDLLTLKRNITVTAGAVETLEFIRQTHHREETITSSETNKMKPKKTKTISDYTLNWKFSVPASLRDEFITVEELARTRRLVGSLDILVYFQPTNDLYLIVPGKPAGVFSYDIVMDRIGNEDDVKEEISKTLYPFVWRDEGPVELDKYFGPTK